MQKNSYRRFLLALACSAALAGCTYVNTGARDIAGGFKSFGDDMSDMLTWRDDRTVEGQGNAKWTSPPRSSPQQQASAAAAGQSSSVYTPYVSPYSGSAVQASRATAPSAPAPRTATYTAGSTDRVRAPEKVQSSPVPAPAYSRETTKKAASSYTPPPVKTAATKTKTPAIGLVKPWGPGSGASSDGVDSSVEVYSLDDAMQSAPVPAAAPAPVQRPAAVAPSTSGYVRPWKAPEGAGITSSRDSSVTVYPFDIPGAGFTPAAPGKTEAPLLQVAAKAEVPARIYFASGSSELGQSAKQVIAHIAQRSGGGLIRIEGFASIKDAPAGVSDPHAASVKVATDRAMSVSRALMDNGVPAQLIKVSAKGDMPDAGAGEASTSRVEIYSGSSL